MSLLPWMGLAGGGGGFDPSAYAGYSADFFADAGVTKDGSDLVGTWADSAGVLAGPPSVSQATTGLKPLYVASATPMPGRAALKFDVVDDVLTGSTLPAPWDWASSWTLYFQLGLASIKDSLLNYIFLEIGSSLDPLRLTLDLRTAGEMRLVVAVRHNAGASLSNVAHAWAGYTDAPVFAVQYSTAGGQISAYLGGANSGEAQTGIVAPLDTASANLWFGRAAAGGDFWWRRALFYQGAHATVDVQAISTALETA